MSLPGSLPGQSWTILVPEKLACDVYIGCMPLRLPVKALPPILERFGVRHFYTLVQQPSDGTCVYYDFLPANPEDPLVVAAALAGRKVEGIVQEKTIERPPTRKCWWIGKSQNGDGFESARNFNNQWDSRLSIFRHDCRHHTNGLVHHLTGKKNVISQLDMRSTAKCMDTSPESLMDDEDWLTSISINYPTLTGLHCGL